MAWVPNKEQQKYLRLIISMSTDCLMEKGVDNIGAFMYNIRTLGDMIAEKEEKKNECTV